jgi:hypothetical protein
MYSMNKTGVGGKCLQLGKMWQVHLAAAQPLLQSLLWGEKIPLKLWVQHLDPASASLHHVVQRWHILNVQNSTRISSLVLLALLHM